jgi:cold shock CspA family protein
MNEMISSDGVRRGTIKRWFDDRGYGFLRVAGTGEDIFVHATSLTAPQLTPRLQVGEEVEFQTVTTPRGKLAVNVVIVSDREETPYKDKYEGAGFPRSTKNQ